MTNIQQATEAALAVIQREEGLVTQDEVVKALDLRNNLKAAVRELDRQIEDAAIKWINDNGEIEVGTVRYYVGTDKRQEAVNLRDVFNAVLEAAGGDVDAFLETLVSNPLKPGAVRRLVGDEEADRLFRTVTTEDIKTGKPRKRLASADSRFVK